MFFNEGEEKDEYIDIKTLLEDLSYHGYENVLIPQAMHHCKASMPEYCEGTGEEGMNYSVSFDLYDGTFSYPFAIGKIEANVETGKYFQGVDNAETLVIDGVYIYVFEFSNGVSSIRFVNDGYVYFIQSELSLSEMMNVAQTIIISEE